MKNKTERISDIYKNTQAKIDKFCSRESAKFIKFIMSKKNSYGSFKEVENALNELSVLRSQSIMKDREIMELKSKIEQLQNYNDLDEAYPSFEYQNELKSSSIARTIEY